MSQSYPTAPAHRRNDANMLSKMYGPIRQAALSARDRSMRSDLDIQCHSWIRLSIQRHSSDKGVAARGPNVGPSPKPPSSSCSTISTAPPESMIHQGWSWTSTCSSKNRLTTTNVNETITKCVTAISSWPTTLRHQRKPFHVRPRALEHQRHCPSCSSAYELAAATRNLRA